MNIHDAQSLYDQRNEPGYNQPDPADIVDDDHGIDMDDDIPDPDIEIFDPD